MIIFIKEKLENLKRSPEQLNGDWERGLSEYSNKLVRQYIPKKANFQLFYNYHLNQINYKLNNKPRELLNFNKPLNVFVGEFKSVAIGR